MTVPGCPALLIEAFAEGPCTGNGAAVVLLDRPLGPGWMQAVAGSLRQSETAFLLQQDGRWLLRWFTPGCEVPLCGHATLAAVLGLGVWGLLPPGAELSFATRSGCLPVALARHRTLSARVTLPGGALLPAAIPEPVHQLLLLRGVARIQCYWRSPLGYQVALLPADAPLATMEGIAGDLVGETRRGLVLMQSVGDRPGSGVGPAVLGEPADYQLRFFAPGLGIEEDPVTGSAHALVAGYWMEHLGRPHVVGWQCSDRPGGMVCDAASSGMIRLSGRGHLLWDGTLLMEPPCGVDEADDGPGWQSLLPDASSSAAATTPS